MCTSRNIARILRNEVYCGDRNILKTPARNYLTKKIDPTIKREGYYVRDHHEAIVPRQIWNTVQERLRTDQIKWESGERSRKDHHPYFNRIICASCGQPYRRCIWKNRRGENVPMWKCSGRYKGECYARIVREDELTEAMSTAEKIKVTEFGVVAC